MRIEIKQVAEDLRWVGGVVLYVCIVLYQDGQLLARIIGKVPCIGFVPSNHR
jgi:hypothetical protein